jgi:hypothetical protein
VLPVSSEIIRALLICAGLFTVSLGIVHVVIPVLLDFDHAIPSATADPSLLRPLRVGPIRYQVLRSDVRGVGWVMSNAASYALVSIGLVDLAAGPALMSDGGRLLALWIAGWWLVRAGGQFVVGRRGGDVLVAGWFEILALVHVAAAIH